MIMSDIGVEVGQKMRLAIKAKLSELKCYVDDELPDYIMVMIANKRTKTQMKDDLSLFLRNETSLFVEWLHIVLKKLKQVQVTNPNAFKNASKRKSNEYVLPQDDSKKIKKEEGKVKKEKQRADPATELKSLTDDLPINARSLSEAGKRKIVLLDSEEANRDGQDDEFDIPLLSEINTSNEEQLEALDRKIKDAKSRLGLQVASDDEENPSDEYLSIKPDPVDIDFAEQVPRTPPKKQVSSPQEYSAEVATGEPLKKPIHARITFNKDQDSLRSKYDTILGRSRSTKRDPVAAIDDKSKPRSIRDRLGKRSIKEHRSTTHKFNNAHFNPVGVLSEVTIPPKRMLADTGKDDDATKRDVASVIKVKPRVFPAKATHANVSLLFKAVAEAQRSIRQTPTLRADADVTATEKPAENPPALFTKRFREQELAKRKATPEKQKKGDSLISPQLKGRLGEQKLNEIKKFLVGKQSIDSKDTNPSRKLEKGEKDVSPNDSVAAEAETHEEIGKKQQFIVTLDGIDTSKYRNIDKRDENEEGVKGVGKTRRTPSPIIFTPEKSLANVRKPKEKVLAPSVPFASKHHANGICKYYPNCRHGNRCDYVHPIACKMFPNCKFGDKCAYDHPVCKFEASCTRKKCPFRHSKSPVQPIIGITAICKFFPNCTNEKCPFVHLKTCKFGVYCKNTACPYDHSKHV